MNIYEEPSDGGINTPSDYQGWLCLSHAYSSNTVPYLSHNSILRFIVLKYIYIDAYSRPCTIYVLILLYLSYKFDIGILPDNIRCIGMSYMPDILRTS
jgi:hypothetical protein